MTTWAEESYDQIHGSRTGRATSTTPNIWDVERLTLEDLIHIKQTYEWKLRKAVITILDEFRSKTGYTPSAVEVEMVCTTQVQDRWPRYALSQVKLRIDL